MTAFARWFVLALLLAAFGYIDYGWFGSDDAWRIYALAAAGLGVLLVLAWIYACSDDDTVDEDWRPPVPENDELFQHAHRLTVLAAADPLALDALGRTLDAIEKAS